MITDYNKKLFEKFENIKTAIYLDLYQKQDQPNGFLFKPVRSYNVIVICFKPKFAVETEVANNVSPFYLLLTLKGVKSFFLNRLS